MTPVRLEPAAPWSRVKHSTNEQLRSHNFNSVNQSLYNGSTIVGYSSNPWVTVFRIIPEIQDFEADCPQKVSLKILNQEDYNSFFVLYSSYLKTIVHINL